MAFFNRKTRLELPLLIHKECRKYLMNINSRNIVIVVFIDHIDEMHGLSAETEVTDPFFEIMMLIFNFFYQ